MGALQFEGFAVTPNQITNFRDKALRDFIFIGGSGRSGTSFLTSAIGLNDRVASFPGIELKFLTSRSGLIDLKHHIVYEYDIGGAQIAIEQFEIFLRRILFEKFFNAFSVDAYCPPETLKEASDKFMQTMRMDGYARLLTPEEFDAAARDLLSAMYSSAAHRSGAEPIYNLEKTPHSLLHMKSLNEIFPNSRFIHVMRDPRAVVLSLLKMDWAPDTIDECVTWVKCYCLAWGRSREAARASGVNLAELKLEDIAEDREGIAAELSEHLGITISPDVFAGVRADAATSWKSKCSPEDYSRMTEKLSGEISLLGYQP